MSSTKTPPSATTGTFAAGGFVPPAPTLRRSRNLPGAVLGVLVVVVCALAVAALAASGTHRAEVLVVSRPIPAGSTIRPADLTTAGVAADAKVHAIGASEAPSVVGRVAGDNLAAGTLLVRGELAEGPAVPHGMTIVGLALKPGFLPTGLAAQETVSVISTPPGSTTDPSSDGRVSGATAGVLVGAATVYSVDSSPDGQSSLVSVEVPASSAPTVAEANAQGGVSLVLVGG